MSCKSKGIWSLTHGKFELKYLVIQVLRVIAPRVGFLSYSKRHSDDFAYYFLNLKTCFLQHCSKFIWSPRVDVDLPVFAQTVMFPVKHQLIGSFQVVRARLAGN